MPDQPPSSPNERLRLPHGIHGGRTDLVDEFFKSPFGRHSPDLQALLNHMRGGPILGKYFLWMVEPHRKWALARYLDSEPLTPELVGDVVFDDIEDAERHVFELRWETLFGAKPARTTEA